MDKQEMVNDWIRQNFHMEDIEVSDAPVLPYGRLITDVNGETMIVFYDFMYGRVDFRFPDYKEVER